MKRPAPDSAPAEPSAAVAEADVREAAERDPAGRGRALGAHALDRGSLGSGISDRRELDRGGRDRADLDRVDLERRDLDEGALERLRGTEVVVRANGFLYRGTLVGADDEEVYLRGELRWVVLPMGDVEDVRRADTRTWPLGLPAAWGSTFDDDGGA